MMKVKPFFKIALIIITVIFVSEFIGMINKSKFMQPLANKLDSVNEAKIDGYYTHFASKLTTIKIPDLIGLFNGSKYLKFDNTLRFKSRGPVSEFTYQNRYHIQAYKIDTINKMSFKRDLLEKSINVSLSDNNSFAINKINTMTFYYNNLKSKNVNNIVLTLDGTGTREITLNDSIAYYYSQLNNMSINYNGTVQDMVVNFSLCPTELLLLKKNQNVYVLLLESDKPADIPNPGLLLSLISSRFGAR